MKLPINYNTASPQERRKVRELYVKLQHGLCVHCNGYLSRQPPQFIMDKWIDKKLFPKTMFDHRVHLHHNHTTGMTIGAVHAECNAILWQYHGE